VDALLVILLVVVILGVLLALGVPISFCLCIAGFVGLWILRDMNAARDTLALVFYSATANHTLTVVPLFIVMGHFAYSAGIVEKAYLFAYRWIGGLTGGLAMATTMTCAIFGAVSGSSVAATASIGRITVPEMVERYGYDVRIATGTVAASGTLAMIIPPSIVLVVLAPLLEVSVGLLLIAGVVPGIISALIYMAMIWTRGTISPALMPRPSTKTPWRLKVAAIPGLWGVAAIFSSVVLGIYFGVFTPTEAAAVGAVVALAMLVRTKGKREWWGSVKEAFFETARTTSMLFFIFVGAMLLIKLLALSGATDSYAQFVGGLPLPPSLIMFGVLLVCIPLGMVMSGLGTVLIAAPLVAPVAYHFGYDGIWLGIMLIKFAELGSITPPVCMSVYALKGVLGPAYALTDIIRGTLWFMAMDILTIILLFSFPEITMWVPHLMMAR